MRRGSGAWTVVIAVVAVAGSFVSVATAQTRDGATALEAEAARVLANGGTPFPTEAALAVRLRDALAREADAETEGRLALLWVRAMRAALERIPMDARKKEPYQSFLKRHGTDVVYNEPGGEWLLHAETIWSLQAEHRGSLSAEALAWEAADNALPGECEGYPPCELAQLDVLYGEYLRRQPDGEHAAEASRRIGVACDELQRLLDSAGGQAFFNPVTDCTDLVPKGNALADALRRAHVDVSVALSSLNALRARCPAK